MKERFSREATIDVAADAVSTAFAIPEPADISTTYFLNLQLFSSTGALLSRNFYWLSTKQDVPDFTKTEWYYTPLSAYTDFTALQNLPKVKIKASINGITTDGTDTSAHITVENPSAGLAFLVRLRLMKVHDGAELLPVFFDDNYLSLLPGEKREISVKVRNAELNGYQPALAIDGFNITPDLIQ
jgi:exo-1,4-beta-D-glucosaminidase